MADQVTTSLAQAKVLVMQGLAGKAPRVNATNNHWEVWDNATEQWVDTGVAATGAKGDQGDDGFSPEVTITAILNGHRVNITDEDHPAGQNFDVFNGTNGHSPYIDSTTNTWWYYDDTLPGWVDSGIPASGGGSSVTVDDALSIISANPVQNKVVTAALNNKGTYSKPNTGIPATDLASDVQTSLGKADTAVLYNTQTLTEAQKAQARQNIDAASIADLGTVFTLKGGVATVNDLPQTGNSIGDVWYVESVSAGFIWITSTAYPNGYWEELGETIDMSAYIEKPQNPTANYVLTWNGSAWVAAAVPDELPTVTAADNGKFLRVVSGAWAAQAVPSAESNSFGGGA